MSTCPYCGDDTEAPVSARWEFTLPLPWPSSQHTGGKATHHLANSGAGRWAYKKVRDDFETAIDVATVDIPFSLGRFRRVILTRLWGKRQRAFDPSNLVAGAKPVEDALVQCSMIDDDSAKYARIHHHQRRAADGVAAIHVLIEELI